MAIDRFSCIRGSQVSKNLAAFSCVVNVVKHPWHLTCTIELELLLLLELYDGGGAGRWLGDVDTNFLSDPPHISHLLLEALL